VCSAGACATRARVPYGPQNLPTGCTLVPDVEGILEIDLDRDGDLDMIDFSFFQRCHREPDVTPGPACGA
jgi:hypothetical protein